MAVHNYESKHGRLPPAVVYGADGKPLLSWRVLILPYIEQKALYDEFNLDESWNSPHNLSLLPKMPVIYAVQPPSAARRAPAHHTILHVFVGPGAAFEGREGTCLKTDFPDGTSRTLLVVEAGPPVPWTKTDDFIYDPSGPLPELKGGFRDHFRAVFVDGSVMHQISYRLNPKTLRAAITRNGGEEFNLGDLDPAW
jgi:hypothetical protein